MRLDLKPLQGASCLPRLWAGRGRLAFLLDGRGSRHPADQQPGPVVLPLIVKHVPHSGIAQLTESCWAVPVGHWRVMSGSRATPCCPRPEARWRSHCLCPRHLTQGHLGQRYECSGMDGAVSGPTSSHLWARVADTTCHKTGRKQHFLKECILKNEVGPRRLLTAPRTAAYEQQVPSPRFWRQEGCWGGPLLGSGCMFTWGDWEPARP